jgi:hypothetical protein
LEPKDIKMLKELIKLANELDERGLVKEAGILDEIIRMAAVTEEYVILIKTGELVGTFNYSRKEESRFWPNPKGVALGFSKGSDAPDGTKKVSINELPPQAGAAKSAVGDSLYTPESYESYDTEEAEMRREDEADHRSILDKSHAEAFEENISNEDVENLFERLYDPDLHRPVNAEELTQLIEDMGLRIVPRHTAEMLPVRAQP